MTAFSDPDAVARYAEGPARIVPGFRDMQRMAALLLLESLSDTATVLVLGAGGGLELKVFADLHPEWRFVGVDPSQEMLDLAVVTDADHASRVQLQQGYVDAAPMGPFDAATCLLTMHFMDKDERRNTLAALRRRLKPGAPLLVAHLSFPQDAAGKALWLRRYAAFAESSGIAAANSQAAAEKIGKELPVLSPNDDEAMLREAGFRDVDLFYAGLAFRGWIAFA